MPRFPKFSLNSQARRASLWLMAFGLVGVLLVLLYHDAEQQDSAYHFLFARWAWQHPVFFVSVWARPLFTLIYFPPSLLGYPAAKLFTVIISLATAWQTFRLAEQFKLQRAELAVPFLYLQPAFFVLCSVVMTETLFALLFVVALRFHLAGRIKSGMVAASLLILIRPEGFFIGLLWGIWVLRIADDGLRIGNSDSYGKWPIRAWLRTLLRFPIFAIRNPQWLLLGGGMFIWWLAAYWVTGDKLWIAHNWPSDWELRGQANGTGPVWWYVAQLPLIAGVPLIVPFLIGIWRLLKRRELAFATSSFLTLFILHSVMFARGWFGSAGYARYFVCVSPVIALITLAGWNEFVGRQTRFFNPAELKVAVSAISLAAIFCLVYVDSIRFTRDARAVDQMHEWLKTNHPQLIDRTTRLICSQAYTRILLERDPWEKPSFTADRELNLELIRSSPAGTLVLWDEETGPKWYKLREEDFQLSGYELIKSQSFILKGWLIRLGWKYWGGPRLQRMHWLYKRQIEEQSSKL